jgi:hypothetical protein
VVGELKKTVLTVVSLIIFTCLIFPSLVNADVTWDIQVVSDDASSIDYGYCPIKVDSDGNPHIAYTGSPKWGYVSWNGSGWDIQKLKWGFVRDLVLDTNGTPHITYGSLAYATWNQTQWEFQTIATDDTAYSSIALDSSGVPHVAYSIGSELRYASQNGSNWTIQTVDDMPDIARRVSLALDSNDIPYIMYYTVNPVHVKLAVWKNPGWTIEPVLDSLNLNEYGNMVLDSNDNPHFLIALRRYFGDHTAFLRDVLYVSWDGSDWNIQTVASDVYLHDIIGFLTLGPNEYPHIIYTTRAEQLIYTRWTGAAWENYIVDTQRIPDKTCYLAVDSEGNPHISYLKIPPDQSYVPDRLNLMYATANIPKTPDVPSPLSNPTTLITTAVILGTAVAIFLRLEKKKT